MSKRDSSGNVVSPFAGRGRFAPRAPRMAMRRYARRVPAKKGLVSLIKRVATSTEEKKESNQYSLNTPLPSVAAAGWTTSSIPICPFATGFIIPQGTGQGQRVGNQIRTQKCVVRGIIHPNQYDATTNPQPIPTEIRMILFKDKFFRSGQPSAVALDLFQNGSTVLPPQNDLADMMLDLNRDRYQIYHDQILKIGYESFTSATGGVPVFGNFANNDFSLNAKFEVDCTKFLPAHITYNDGGTSPMSDTLWMIFLPAAANGGAIAANSTGLSMAWTAMYQYTDA